MQSAILEKNSQQPKPISRESGGYETCLHTIRSGDSPAQAMQSASFEFVKKRNAPDAVVIGPHGHILFVSQSNSSVLRLLEANEQNTEEHEAQRQLKQILNRLRITVFSQMEMSEVQSGKDAPRAFFSFREQSVSLRGQLLKGVERTPDFVMILIEELKRSVRSVALNQCTLEFTPRQQAVLCYVKKGFTNKEIACVLKIGVHTVKDHVKQIMRKVNVHTRSGIIGKLEESLAAQG